MTRLSLAVLALGLMTCTAQSQTTEIYTIMSCEDWSRAGPKWTQANGCFLYPGTPVFRSFEECEAFRKKNTPDEHDASEDVTNSCVHKTVPTWQR